MKKKPQSEYEDNLRPEYDLRALGAVRGKHAVNIGRAQILFYWISM
jgi:hypothetical protein